MIFGISTAAFEGLLRARCLIGAKDKTNKRKNSQQVYKVICYYYIFVSRKYSWNSWRKKKKDNLSNFYPAFSWELSAATCITLQITPLPSTIQASEKKTLYSDTSLPPGALSSVEGQLFVSIVKWNCEWEFPFQFLRPRLFSLTISSLKHTHLDPVGKCMKRLVDSRETEKSVVKIVNYLSPMRNFCDF